MTHKDAVVAWQIKLDKMSIWNWNTMVQTKKNVRGRPLPFNFGNYNLPKITNQALTKPDSGIYRGVDKMNLTLKGFRNINPTPATK